jgi:hypothetical protein
MSVLQYNVIECAHHSALMLGLDYVLALKTEVAFEQL